MADARFQDWTSLCEAERRREMAACRGRLDEVGPALNAVVQLAGPREADSTSGPLAGLPYAAKDMLDRADRASGWGGVRPNGTPGGVTAGVLQQLDAAGAVELAVSAMTELAYEPSGYNAQRGRTLNPWHPDVVSGGSSSGSAALVACGAVVLGIGSDTGGSVRIPASCCGITGLKPTGGAERDPAVMPLAPSMDTIGFMARSAAELAMVLPVVCPETGASPAEPFGRAAILVDRVEEASAGVQRACAAGVEALRATGVRPGAVRLGDLFGEIDGHALTVMQAESARAHAASSAEELRISSTLKRRLAKGFEIDEAALADSFAARAGLAEAFFARLGGAELALLPVMPLETPLASQADPTSADFQPRVLYAMSRFTRFVNFLQLPALSVPCGFDGRGVPIGLQMIGPPGSEARLLATAARLQWATAWHGRCPPALARSHPQSPES
jgi:aspartyl-tRNA(Asn)/glutamyl-tRNA(Gln) amidotransferase subunit A